ncbi:MAG: hypothetical protein AAF493_00255 [Pseudomonadota bacterium]
MDPDKSGRDVFVNALHRALPRLLSGFNADPTSDYAGAGDRLFWGWKLSDFPNGTFQGAVHGMALLYQANALPSWFDRESVIPRLQQLVAGLRTVTASNGSLCEALPNEGSFCVTALVASDVLAAHAMLAEDLTTEEQQRWVEAVRPLVGFLFKQDEHHGLISNHLASAALAMYRWHNTTGDDRAQRRGKRWLDRILANQSTEGWYSEYGGPDPGYQSWCTTQLAQLHRLRPDLGLLASLSKSVSFLSYAAHPDGSFGGVYGQRNTRFLLPGGLCILSGECDVARALAEFARYSIERRSCVSLDAIDAGNLVPFFNDYALAATAVCTNGDASATPLPCQSSGGREWFPDAGWLVERGEKHYSILALKRGGAFVSFTDGERTHDDPGAVVRDGTGRWFASQLGHALHYPDALPSGDAITLTFPLYRVVRPTPTPGQFVILRGLAMTAFRWRWLGNVIKRLLARYLINRKPRPAGRVHRSVEFGPRPTITDSVDGIDGANIVANRRHFSASHMASQGYWQRGDDDPSA